MISQRTRGLHHLLIFLQAVLACLALLASMALAFGFFTGVGEVHLSHYPFYGVCVVFGILLESLKRGEQKTASDLSDRSFLRQHSVSLRQTLYAAAGLLLFLAVTKDTFISRTVLVLYLPALYFALFASNYTLPSILARWMFTGPYEDRAILIGSARCVARLRPWLNQKAMFGFRPVGIVSDEDDAAVAGLPHLGKQEELEGVLEAHHITQAILLELPECPVSHQRLVNLLQARGVGLLILSNLEEKLRHPAFYFEEGGLSFIASREEQLENPLNRFLKRALDLAIAIPVVFLILPPLTVLVSLWHWLRSPGPLFFRQVRAGIQNRQFGIIKFRRMHLPDRVPAAQAARGDRRILPGGELLRRLQIDELPQFLNVLRGEMSVVGPRPHRTEHNQHYSRRMARFHIRAVVKPGITGLAQVRGFRGEVTCTDDIEQRLASDIEYVETWSLALDLTILSRTMVQVVLFSLNSLFTNAGRSLGGGRFVAREEEGAAEVSESSPYMPGAGYPDTRQILGIRFFTGEAADAVTLGMQGGLVVAPSAPVLLGLEKDSTHRSAVVGSRVAITDSGLMVLWWHLMTGDKITRVSGLVYLKLLLERPELRAPGAVLWVMPNVTSMQRNLSWLRKSGFPVTEGDCYLAPHYNTSAGEVDDPVLLELIRARRPPHIIMAVGGGVQEKLGAKLQSQLDYRPAIHCTGAAIGFLSGDQIRIPMWMDRFRLGWFCRCLDDPKRFVPRYWESRKLVGLMFRYHGRLPMADTKPVDS